jgi:thiol-disulfide isomerase/thioredoxin
MNLSYQFSTKNLLSFCLASCLGLTSWQAQALEVGATSPFCKLQSLTDGHEVSLAAPGKVVYIDFWASWCGPCVQSMPFLHAINAKYRQQGLELVAINLDENKEDATSFLQKHPVNITLASNEDGQCSSLYGVQSMPSSYLIDKKGKVRYVQLGFNTTEEAQIHQKIQSLLHEK